MPPTRKEDFSEYKKLILSELERHQDWLQKLSEDSSSEKEIQELRKEIQELEKEIIILKTKLLMIVIFLSSAISTVLFIADKIFFK